MSRTLQTCKLLLCLLSFAHLASFFPGTSFGQDEATEKIRKIISQKSLARTGLYENDIRAILAKGSPREMEKLLKVEQLLAKKFGPTQLIIRGVADGKQPLSAALSVDQLAVLSRARPTIGGLRKEDQVLLPLACQTAFQKQLPPRKVSRGTLVETRTYNLLGLSMLSTKKMLTTDGKTSTTATPTQSVVPWLGSDGRLWIYMRYDFVDTEALEAAIASFSKNRKNRKLLEDHDLLSQLNIAVNQVVVLNSDIKNGALELKKPGYLETPKRYLVMNVNDKGKVIAKLSVPSSTDRKKLKDAHNNVGAFKNIKGVPVGKVLPAKK